MKKDQIIQFAAGIEQRLDSVLFAKPGDDDDSALVTAGKIAGTGAVVGGLGYGAYRGHKAIMGRFGEGLEPISGNTGRGRFVQRKRTIGEAYGAAGKAGVAAAKSKAADAAEAIKAAPGTIKTAATDAIEASRAALVNARRRVAVATGRAVKAVRG